MSGIYIVIPTYNEAENIKTILTKILNLNNNFHIIVIDDNSPDGTAEIAQDLGLLHGNIIVHRRPGKLGIGSAIRDGMKEALSFPDCKFIVTIDADFSHNPEDIPRLLQEAERVDLVQGSRYIRGGNITGWRWYRKLLSWVANHLYRYLFNIHQYEITTYFRVYSRKCADTILQHVTTDKYEFAFASALVVHDNHLKVKEVPIEFTNRVQGKSKLKVSDIVYSFRYLLYTFIIRLARKLEVQRFLRFCIVGATGVLINQALLWLLTDKIGIYYLYSALVSIEASIFSNFMFNDSWTFRDRRKMAGHIVLRFLKYNLLCAIGSSLNYIILWLLTDTVHFHYLISNLFGIAAAVTWNYLISLNWAWSGRGNKSR